MRRWITSKKARSARRPKAIGTTVLKDSFTIRTSNSAPAAGSSSFPGLCPSSRNYGSSSVPVRRSAGWQRDVVSEQGHGDHDVVAHQPGKLDRAGDLERFDHPRIRLVRHFPLANQLRDEIVHCSLIRLHSFRPPPVFHRVDDALREAAFHGERRVRVPLVLAVEMPGRDDDGEFRKPRRIARVETEVLPEVLYAVGQLRHVYQ